MRRSLGILTLMIPFFGVCPISETPGQVRSDVVRQQVRPILETHCFGCHGPQKQDGQLKISSLDLDIVKGADAEHWQEVLDRLNAGTMPPKGKSKISAGEREQLTSWLTGQLKLAAEMHRSNGGRSVLRRLTRYEYNNTLQDLLGVDIDFARDLPPEGTAELGFQNNSNVLVTSTLHLDHFQKIAKRGLEMAIGPREKPVPVELTIEPGDKLPKAKGVKGGVLRASIAAGGVEVVRLPHMPLEGPMMIRITASASRTSQGDYPSMQVEMGRDAKKGRRTKLVGEVGLDARSEASRAYEFHVQVEDYPLAGPMSSPALLVIRNRFDSGTSGVLVQDQPRLNISRVEVVAPYYRTWPPESRSRILFESKSQGNEKVYAREVIEKFMQRAYRRPVAVPEVTRMHELFVKLRPNSPSFEEAMIGTLSAVLSSPGFLLLAEPATNQELAEKARKLTDHEMASRLSYFLWSTMPDDLLFTLAEQGKLQQANVLREQVKRMLEDPRSKQFSQRFVTQWLDLESIDRVAVDPAVFPTFKKTLKPILRQETVQFFDTILREDLSCLNVLDSDFAVLNAPLATHYGIPGVAGDQFRKVPLKPEHHRGGILTHGSILTGNSSGDDTHPVKRGVWVLERLLNDPPPPPPPEVPTLPQTNKKGERLTLTEKLLVHRQENACMNCHQKIDPWGLAFENYNGVGVWREKQSAVARPVGPQKKMNKKSKAAPVVTREVEAKTELPDGVKIDGLGGLKQYLLTEKRERFAETLVSKVFSYALWRNLEFSDRQTVQNLSQEFRKSNYRLRSLITEIVLSETFRTK